MKPYYTAYDERYKTVHRQGLRWASDAPTPIVGELLHRYGIGPERSILEIGCGEGRDARALLAQGYDLLATDVSPEAVRCCREALPAHAARFQVLDCLTQTLDRRFDFIYAVAVLHMLVPDADRAGFCRFLRDHLAPGGLALICSMGDGESETQSDVSRAFELQTRNHPSGPLQVAATSCRMVSMEHLRRELTESGLQIRESGLTPCPPEFDTLLYAVVSP